MSDAIGRVKPARRETAATRRALILDAACALIFERGYEPVSLAEIGAAAGVSGPAIYRHFGSKAEILETLCHSTIDRLIELAGPRRENPREELTALVDGQVRLVVLHPQMVRVFEDEERALPGPMRRQVRRRERDHAGRWVEALRRLHPSVAPPVLEIAAYATVGMILSAPRWPLAVRTVPGLEARLRDAAWRMLDGIGFGAVNDR